MRSHPHLATLIAAIAATLLLAGTAHANIGKVAAIGDSMASGTRLGPQVPGSIIACGQSTGSYPELAMARSAHGTWTNATCNGGWAGIFNMTWPGMDADPEHYQYNDGTPIPAQYNAITANTDVVIVGAGGNEAAYGEVVGDCLGHSDDYNANRCTTKYGANGAGLLAKAQTSKSWMSGVLDTVHSKAMNAKVFLIGIPRITPPDGAGCWPNPILTLADAPVWAVWEDSVRQAMLELVAARSSYVTYVDMQAISGTTHTMCAPPTMRWMNPWTTDNIDYPGLPLHNTPFGADATADALVKAFKAAGLNTETPNTPTLTRTNPAASPTNSTTQTFTYSGASGNTFKCRLDNAAYATCPSSPVTLNALTHGAHTYSVKQVDSSGKVSPAAMVTWTVDTLAPPAPTVTRTAPNSSPTKSSTQTISYSGGEGGGNFECRLDSGSYSACASSPLTLSGLTTANHTYYIRQVDSAGNVGPAASVSWVVDVTPPGAPTVTRTNPVSTTTNLQTQVITYSGAESGGTFQCMLDAAPASACTTSPVTLTGLAAGTHTFSVTQTDAVGNVGGATTVTWTIDTTAPAAPTVTRTSPTASPTNSASQTLSYSGAEPGGSFRCRLDAGSYAACPGSPVIVSGLAGGSHTYSVTQTDDAGNTSPAATVSWTVDLTPPPVPIVSGPSGTTAFSSASISYSDAESGVSFQCRLDSGAYATCPPSPVSLGGLAAGPHTYYVTATDATGNVSSPGTASWTVDPSGFTVSVTSGPNNPSTVRSATFVFAATETAGTTYACKLDGASFSTCGSPKVFAGLADGSHTFTVHASNGGQSTPDVSRTWVIDATPPGAPALARTSPTASPTNSTSQTFSLTAAEPGGVLSCKLDAGSWATCPASPVTIAGLADGSHSYSARQADAAGNIGSVATVSWSVDATAPAPPSIARTNPTAALTSSKSQTISYGALESGASTLCKIDTGSYTACPASPFTLSELSEGSHTVQITQTDAAGNTSPPASVSWTVDSVAPGLPTLLRTSPTVSPTNSKTQEVLYGGTEGGGNWLCKLDSSGWTACPASPLTISDLGDGQHTLSISQSDAAGNTSPVNSVVWTIDTIAPAKPGLGFNRPSVTNVNSAEIGISPAESGGTMQCAFDSGAWTTCPSSPVELTGLADGNHSYAIRQVDDAGNIGPGAQASWLIDTVAPAAPTVTRTSTGTGTSATFEVTPKELEGALKCKLDGAAWATCPASPFTIDGLSLGTHTLSVTHTDKAGNVSNAESITWLVDTLPPLSPTVTRTSPTANPTSLTSQTISFSGAEPGGTLLCKLDGASFASCPISPATLTGLSNGSHTYSVKQIDESGNPSPVAAVSWTVDNVAPLAPTVARTNPSESPTRSTTQQISFGAAEPGGRLECTLDGIPLSSCQSSPVTFNVSNGAHSFSVAQIDDAGNRSPSAAVDWTVDNVAPAMPTVTRTAPTANPTLSRAQTITYSGEPGGSFICKFDDAPLFTACPANPVQLSNLADGPHTFSVTQVDAAHNASPPTTVNWTVGDVPELPALERTPAADPSNSREQTISYSGSVGNWLKCKLDDGGWVGCPASPVTIPFEDGMHTVQIKQVDESGLEGPIASVSWTIDTKAPDAPTVTRIDPVENPTESTTQVLTYGGEPGGLLECRLDTDEFEPCGPSPLQLSGLATGTHTYAVRQTDSAGNVGAVGSATWTIPDPAEPIDPVGPPPKAGETPVLPAPLKATISAVLPHTIKPARSGVAFTARRHDGGGTFSVTLSRAATISFRLERLSAGRRSGSHCRATERLVPRHKRCTTIKRVTTAIALELPAGRSKIRISGRSGRHALKNGRYRVHATSDQLAAAVTGASFRIKR